MNCAKAQTYIPHLRTGSLSGRRRAMVERHLSQCETCRRWLEAWEEVCHLSIEASLPPADLDWEPFNQALEAELQRRPAPGRQRLTPVDIWRYLTGDLWRLSKRAHIRAILAGAAAALVVLISSHIYDISPPRPGETRLTIGTYLTSNLQGDVVLYQESEPDRVYYSEVVSLELIEGKY